MRLALPKRMPSMKKFLCALTAVAIGGVGAAQFSTDAAYAVSDSRRGCLSVPGFINVDPSPTSEAHLTERGVTLTVDDLPPNVFGEITVMRGNLVNPLDHYVPEELTGDDSDARLLEELRRISPVYPDDTGDFYHAGFFMTDSAGTLSLTFGGQDGRKPTFTLPADWEKFGIERDVLESELAYLEEKSWTSDLPESEAGYLGNYVVVINVYNPVWRNGTVFSADDGRVTAVSYDEIDQIADKKVHKYLEQGYSEEGSELLTNASFTESVCTEFIVAKEVPPTPEPTPTPESTPTPEPSERPTPEPSETPTLLPSASPTPEPSSSQSPEPSGTPTPEPSASVTPSETVPGSLPQTGGNVGAVLTAGGILLAAGGALVVLARRRSLTH